MEIDPNKIGDVFAIGGENIIRWYDSSYLLKSPVGIRIRLGKERFVKEVVDDFEVFKEYFKDYLPEINILVKNNGKSYDIIQKFVTGDTLRKDDLKDPSIRNQFNKLVQSNQSMEKQENLSWDFFGAWSLFLGNKNMVRNIIVTPEKELKIIDIGTMRISRKKQPLLVWLIIKWALNRQNRCLDYLLG